MQETTAKSEILSGDQGSRTLILNKRQLKELKQRIKVRHDEWARAEIKKGLERGRIDLSDTGRKSIEISIEETELMLWEKALSDDPPKGSLEAEREGMRKVFAGWHKIRKEEIDREIKEYGAKPLDEAAWTQIYARIRERLLDLEKELLPEEASR